MWEVLDWVDELWDWFEQEEWRHWEVVFRFVFSREYFKVSRVGFKTERVANSRSSIKKLQLDSIIPDIRIKSNWVNVITKCTWVVNINITQSNPITLLNYKQKRLRTQNLLVRKSIIRARLRNN